jgi:choline monooxygenase
MHEGRKSLYRQGKYDFGPYQLPTEEGMRHFHEFLVRELSNSVVFTQSSLFNNTQNILKH